MVLGQLGIAFPIGIKVYVVLQRVALDLNILKVFFCIREAKSKKKNDILRIKMAVKASQ